MTVGNRVETAGINTCAMYFHMTLIQYNRVRSTSLEFDRFLSRFAEYLDANIGTLLAARVEQRRGLASHVLVEEGEGVCRYGMQDLRMRRGGLDFFRPDIHLRGI